MKAAGGPSVPLGLTDGLALSSSNETAVQTVPETYAGKVNCLVSGQGL